MTTAPDQPRAREVLADLSTIAEWIGMAAGSLQKVGAWSDGLKAGREDVRAALSRIGIAAMGASDEGKR